MVLFLSSFVVQNCHLSILISKSRCFFHVWKQNTSPKRAPKIVCLHQVSSVAPWNMFLPHILLTTKIFNVFILFWLQNLCAIDSLMLNKKITLGSSIINITILKMKLVWNSAKPSTKLVNFYGSVQFWVDFSSKNVLNFKICIALKTSVISCKQRFAAVPLSYGGCKEYMIFEDVNIVFLDCQISHCSKSLYKYYHNKLWTDLRTVDWNIKAESKNSTALVIPFCMQRTQGIGA